MDSIGSVTSVEIFSKTNKHLYQVNAVNFVDMFLKIILDIKTLLKHSPTIIYNLLHEIIGF